MHTADVDDARFHLVIKRSASMRRLSSKSETRKNRNTRTVSPISFEEPFVHQKPIAPATLFVQRSQSSEICRLRSRERIDGRPLVKPHRHEEQLNKAISGVVAVNIVFLGLETDFTNTSSPAKDRIFWIMVESIMIIIFAAEVLVRMYFERWRWLCSAWNWLDLVLVVLSIVETWVMNFIEDSGRLRMLGLMRSVRMVRLARVFRLLRFFSPLFTIVMAFKEAVSGLLFICGIMVLGIYVCAIFITCVVGRSEMRELELGGITGAERFGSVMSSMYSLFELITLEGWVEVARPIVEQQPAMAFFFVSFILMFTFGLLQMVVAVVVEKTLQSAKRSKIMSAEKVQSEVSEQLEKMRELFVECDTNQDETIDRNEFAAAMANTSSDGKLKACFEALGIPTDDALALFDVLDADVSGQLNMQEFLSGVARVLGASDPLWDHLATHALMMGLRKQFKELHHRIRNTAVKRPKAPAPFCFEVSEMPQHPFTPPPLT